MTRNARYDKFVINIAPLREHKEDVAEIADGFWMDMFGSHLRKDQCDALAEYDYPGNVRELINTRRLTCSRSTGAA